MKSLKRKLILWFMESTLYRSIIIKVVPFIRFNFYYTKLRGESYHEGYAKLQAGHMIGTIDYSKLTGMLIPKVSGGILSHAALCVGKRNPEFLQINGLENINGKGLEVVEMTHSDFTFSDFFDIVKESERVIIFDCMDWDLEHKKKVIEAAISLRKATYDVEFEFGISSLYCSELIYLADTIANNKDYYLEVANPKPIIQANPSDLMGLGRQYISPDGLLTAKNIKVVWDSKGELTGKTGSEISDIIFKGKA
jgi:hypothetical protein